MCNQHGHYTGHNKNERFVRVQKSVTPVLVTTPFFTKVCFFGSTRLDAAEEPAVPATRLLLVVLRVVAVLRFRVQNVRTMKDRVAVLGELDRG